MCPCTGPIIGIIYKVKIMIQTGQGRIWDFQMGGGGGGGGVAKVHVHAAHIPSAKFLIRPGPGPLIGSPVALGFLDALSCCLSLILTC